MLESEKDKKRLIKVDGTQYVGINFLHLDRLVGNLCHVIDLDSDKEHREHVKSEIKMRCRQWLTDEYEMVGYKD